MGKRSSCRYLILAVVCCSGQRDVIQVIQDTDVDLIQTWYTVFTDLVYRLYRPGIQIIQTWYTVFTDLVYRLYSLPGYRLYSVSDSTELSHAGLRGCASQRKTTHNNPCHPPRTTILRRSSAAPSEIVLGRQGRHHQDTSHSWLTLFTLPVPDQQCHRRINSRLRSGFL